MFNNNDLIPELEKLEKFAYKLTRNKYDAEDLMQATVLRAIEKKHLYQDRGDMFSWLSKMMFNLFATQYRRRTRFETQYDPDSFIEKESVEANQEIKIELKDVQKAMGRLSKNHKNILNMVSFGGLAYDEMSKALKIPVGTVRSRIARARENLKATLSAPRIQHQAIAA